MPGGPGGAGLPALTDLRVLSRSLRVRASSWLGRTGIVFKLTRGRGAVECLYRTAYLLDRVPTRADTGDACDSEE